jgi:hypothetical protein
MQKTEQKSHYQLSNNNSQEEAISKDTNLYEMQEIIMQRPATQAHLGDSVRVRYFKLLVNGTDTIRQEIDSLDVPAHFRKRRYTESFISSIYKSRTPWNSILNVQNLKSIKIWLKITHMNKYSSVDATLVIPNQRVLQYLFSIAKENPDTYPYQSSYETEMMLPIHSSKAYIIIIAYKKAKIFYSIEPIVLEELIHKTIDLKGTNEGDLRQRLKVLLNSK